MFLIFSDEWMVVYELGKKETREGGQDAISFSEYITRYREEDLYCVTGLPRYLTVFLDLFVANMGYDTRCMLPYQ